MEIARQACVKVCAETMIAMNAISCKNENAGALVAEGVRKSVCVSFGVASLFEGWESSCEVTAFVARPGSPAISVMCCNAKSVSIQFGQKVRVADPDLPAFSTTLFLVVG